MPLWQTIVTSLILFYNHTIIDFNSSLQSFLFLLLLLCLQAHALVVCITLAIDLLLLPLIPVTAVLVLNRSRSVLIFHVVLNLLELS
jgi:hypothetical protein